VFLFLLEEDPKTYQEAMRSIDGTFWKEAMKSEIDSPKLNCLVINVRTLASRLLMLFSLVMLKTVLDIYLCHYLLNIEMLNFSSMFSL